MGTAAAFVATLPLLEWVDGVFENADNKDDLRRIAMQTGAALGGFTGLMLTVGLWANALFGWEPAWDGRSRRRR